MSFNAAVSNRAPTLHRLSTPRAAALAGVLFAVLFGSAIVLIRTRTARGATPGSQWLDAGSPRLRVAAVLMPFAGICVPVVHRGGARRLGPLRGQVLRLGVPRQRAALPGDDVRAARLSVPDWWRSAARGSVPTMHSEAAAFGQAMLMALNMTYGMRMAAVFMISLATIWLKTGLMPRWLIAVTYGDRGLPADRQ